VVIGLDNSNSDIDNNMDLCHAVIRRMRMYMIVAVSVRSFVVELERANHSGAVVGTAHSHPSEQNQKPSNWSSCVNSEHGEPSIQNPHTSLHSYLVPTKKEGIPNRKRKCKNNNNPIFILPTQPQWSTTNCHRSYSRLESRRCQVHPDSRRSGCRSL